MKIVSIYEQLTKFISKINFPLYYLFLIGGILTLNMEVKAQDNCSITEPANNSCKNLPTEYNELILPNAVVDDKLYYLNTSGVVDINSHISVNGTGTLIFCGGKFNLVGINFNNANSNIIIAKGTTVNFTGGVNLKGKLYNYGTLEVTGHLQINSEGQLINIIGGVIKVNSLNNDAKIINHGIIESNGEFKINSSGIVCAGSGSTILSKSIYNDGKNSIISVSGQNCISFSTSFGGNQPISSSSNTLVCQPSGANSPSNIGNATLFNNCTSCAVPLNIEVMKLHATQLDNTIEIEWNLDIANEDLSYILEVAYNDESFTEIDRVEYKSGKQYFTTSFDIKNFGVLYYRIAKIKRDNSREIIATNLIKIKPVNQFKIYPNPIQNTESIKIQIPFEFKSTGIIEIYDLVGNLVLKKQLIESPSIQLNQIKKGNYLVIIKDNLNNKLHQELLTII